MNKNEILNVVLATIPYPRQVCDIDLDAEDEAIRFTWRANRFRVDKNLSVEEVGHGVLMGSDIAILLRELLRN